MNDLITERLLACIGEIDDTFLQEAEIADASIMKRAKRKRIAKYSVAGLAVSVSVGLAVAYLTRGGTGKELKAA